MVIGPVHAGRFRARGLTLLELMVSLAIATLVALLIASALRMVVGRFADETGIANETGREERVRTLVISQLAWLELNAQGGARRFLGMPDGLEFRTMMNAETPHERKPTVVRFMVESVAGAPSTQRLVYAERTISANELDREVAFDQAGGLAETEGVGGATRTVITDAARQSSKGRPVVEGAKSIKFEYLTYSGGGPVWSPAWNDPDFLPRGVRATFESHDGEVTTWVLPVVATF
jgi:prepilin-type N-terminal cleavage/methylation domain-containing protein